MTFATAADAIAFIEQSVLRPADTYDVLPARLRQIARYPYMYALMAELGHPETTLRVAHIAGTSGKGSTAAMVHAIARAAGVHAGLYTSPYVTVPQERIQIGDSFIDDALFIACTADVSAALGRIRSRFPDFEPHLKMIWVGVMLLAFARAKVDLAVIEVGKGGLYDETNIVSPATSTIVSIGYDHMISLGDTLPEIAFHKAGIIKAGSPVISGVTMSEPRKIIEAQARLAGVPLATIGDEFDYSSIRLTWQATQFQYVAMGGGDLPNCQLGLIGSHYAHNAALAIRTVRTLFPTISDAVIREGLRQAWLPGRFEIVAQQPTVILDAAHNGDKMVALTATLSAILQSRRLIVVFGAMSTKDAQPMLAALAPLRPRLIATAPTVVGRTASPAAHIAQIAAANGCDAVTEDDPHVALDRALHEAQPDDVIVVTGSLFLVSQLRPRFITS